MKWRCAAQCRALLCGLPAAVAAVRVPTCRVGALHRPPTFPAVGPWFRRNLIPCRPRLRKNQSVLPNHNLVGGSRGPTQIHIRGLCD